MPLVLYSVVNRRLTTAEVDGNFQLVYDMANNVSSTAAAAQTAANNAVTTANAAQTTANAAQTTANAALPSSSAVVAGGANTVVKLDGNANFNVGATNTYHMIAKSSASNYVLQIRNTSATSPNGLIVYYSAVGSASGGHFVDCSDNTGTRFSILGNGNVQNSNNSYGAISDQKLKENIQPAPSYWEKFKQYEWVNFTLKNDPAGMKLLGLIAQQAERVSPSVITETPDRVLRQVVKDGKPVYEQVELVPAVLDEAGHIVEPAVMGDDESRPVMDWEETGEVTKGVKYSVVTLQAEVVLQEAQRRIEALEMLVAELQAKIAV